ncbi:MULTISPECIES: GxxExxY protein [unclassified Microcoleus]|uniref:GxxExxY protein n=1 Tax=unclassified Microcoleus TaxID=2642155 RepID=UPI002FD76100
MNTDERRLELKGITEKIIGCAFKVGNTLGCGFLEQVYQNSLVYELHKTGMLVEPQFVIYVHYEDIIVGKFVPDVLVERSVLVELKAIKSLGEREMAQCLNVIKATKLTVCLLINFGNPKVEIQRIVNNF